MSSDVRAQSVKFRAVSRDTVKQRLLEKSSKARNDRRQNVIDGLRGSPEHSPPQSTHYYELCQDFGFDFDEETFNFLLELEAEIRNDELLRIHQSQVELDDPELQYQYYMNQ